MDHTAPEEVDPSLTETPALSAGAGRGIGSALRTIASVTTISRFSGLARDAVCSRIFGAGPIWSAFAFAFLLPNLFRRLFGEGALSAAFLPEYARLVDNDGDAARRYAGATVRWLLITLGAATVLGELILFGLTFASRGDEDGLALRLAMIMLPFMPLVCMTAIFGAMLQCHHRFAVPAAAPILVNTFVIFAAVIWTFGVGASHVTTIYVVSIGVLIAGVVQFVWSQATLRDHRPQFTQKADADVIPILRRTFRRMAPVIVGMSAMQINTLIDGLIASWPILVGPRIGLPFSTHTVAYPLDEASNSVLFFGQRLYHFPLGVFGIALATAVFPALSRAVRHHDFFMDVLHRGVRLSVFIGLPASVGLALVRNPLIEVIYQGGEFTDEDGLRVAKVLLGYSLGVWAFGVTHVLARCLYAQGDTRTPVRISLFFIAANFLLNISLIWVMGESALAWSTTACAVVQCAALLWLSRRRWGAEALDRETVIGVSKSMLATIGMTAAVLVTHALLPDSEDWGGAFARLVTLVTVGGAAYLALARLLHMPELKWLVEKD